MEWRGEGKNWKSKSFASQQEDCNLLSIHCEDQVHSWLLRCAHSARSSCSFSLSLSPPSLHVFVLFHIVFLELNDMYNTLDNDKWKEASWNEHKLNIGHRHTFVVAFSSFLSLSPSCRFSDNKKKRVQRIENLNQWHRLNNTQHRERISPVIRHDDDSNAAHGSGNVFIYRWASHCRVMSWRMLCVPSRRAFGRAKFMCIWATRIGIKSLFFLNEY